MTSWERRPVMGMGLPRPHRTGPGDRQGNRGSASRHDRCAEPAGRRYDGHRPSARLIPIASIITDLFQPAQIGSRPLNDSTEMDQADNPVLVPANASIPKWRTPFGGSGRTKSDTLLRRILSPATARFRYAHAFDAYATREHGAGGGGQHGLC